MSYKFEAVIVNSSLETTVTNCEELAILPIATLDFLELGSSITVMVGNSRIFTVKT